MKQILTILFSLLLVSCVNQKVQERLQLHEIQQANALHDLQYAILHSPQKKITWQQAVNRIEEDNITYLQSYDQTQTALKAQKRTWWTLAPEVFTFMNISKSLTELSDLTTDDLSFSIVANITIPNPWQFYAQLYADYLGMLGTQWNHELTRRNFQVQLYSYYIQQDRLDKGTEELTLLLQRLEQSSSDGLKKLSRQYKQKKLAQVTLKERLRVQLNNMFNTPGENWRLTGNPPDISYAKSFKSLALKKGYGKLGLMLQTLQIEANILRLWNIKVSRWPQLSVGLSSPPLVTSNNSTTTGFNPEQTRLFTGASHGIKLNDPLGSERLRDAEVRAAYTRKQLLLRTESDVSRLYLIKKRYSHLLEIQSDLLDELERNKQQAKTISAPSSVLESYKQRLELTNAIKDNKLQQLQFDFQLWIWDEAYWQKY
ncbi:MAG: hypothetical protein ABGY95_10885 [Rubritalea sp.]|uniref:hypothetical protein n=1 Tax=Rubritalea sp. TaxID=2109375 RepID=UPI0032427A4A